MPSNMRKHIPALDGLRGFFLLVVIAYHYTDSVRAWFPAWASMDVFFALSGYLITWRLLASRQNDDYFSRFYRNRALRIVPMYYVLLILFIGSAWLLVKKEHQPGLSVYLDHWPTFFLFVQNWTFIFAGIPKDVSLLPTWSLGIEEQFYLIWPVIIFLVSGFKNRLRLFSILIGIIILVRSMTFLLLPSWRELNYYNTFFRMDGLLIGSILYLLQDAGKKLPLRHVKQAAILLPLPLLAWIAWLKDAGPFSYCAGTIGYTLFAAWGACLISIIVQSENSLLSRFFNLPFLRYCGKISYSLYLLHMPVLIFLGTRIYYWGIGHWPAKQNFFHDIRTWICLLISFLLSSLSYRFIESFFLRMKTRRLPKPAFNVVKGPTIVNSQSDRIP